MADLLVLLKGTGEGIVEISGKSTFGCFKMIETWKMLLTFTHEQMF